MTHAIAAATVAELVPVAAAALATQPREGAVRDIRRGLLRAVRGEDIFQICDIAAEAVVALAEARADVTGRVEWPPAADTIRLASDFPGYGDDLRPPGGKQL
jgi:hypothetical protein